MNYNQISKIHDRFEQYRSDSGPGTWGADLTDPEGIREEYEFRKESLSNRPPQFQSIIDGLDEHPDAVAVLINGMDSNYWAILTPTLLVSNTTGTCKLTTKSLIEHLEGNFYEDFDLKFAEKYGEEALLERIEQAYQDSFSE